MNAYDKFIQDILTEDVADAAFQGITLQMQGICGLLVGGFFIMAVAWEYAVVTIKGNAYMFRWSEIGRIAILWFVLGIFPGLMAIPAYIADTLRSATSGLASDKNLADYGKYIELRNNFENEIKNGVDESNQYNRQKVYKDQQGNVIAKENVDNTAVPDGSEVESDRTISDWTKVLNLLSFSGGLSMILSTLVYLICQVLKLAMVAFCVSASKVMICLGPLAILFSILPFAREKFSEWFGFYLALLFTPVTLNVIDAVTLHFIYKNLAQNDMHTNLIATTAMDLTILILYLYAFGMTAKYAGTKEAGQAFSQGVRTLLEASNGYSNGKSTKEVFSSAWDNVASTGKDALKVS
jgi:hypothetical protein